jgi:DNA invertase Pin-like site-specific DNA recombinase
MIIGYIRVSTQDQNFTLQENAIKRYADSCDEPYEIYKEKESGAKKDRMELHNALRATQKGNKFVVYKLDRLARSSKQLFDIADKLKEKDVEFISLQDNIDTTTASGRAMFGMLSVFAEFERDIINERTKAGLEAARSRGRIGGRPKIDLKTRRQIKILFEQGESVKDIAKEFNVGRSTVYKILSN